MRDGKEGINKEISDYEEHGKQVELTEREKSLIEYGYVQCMLQVGYDIGTKSESFICGLQEMVLELDSRRKLDILNRLEVTDWDCDSESLIYVLVKNSELNKLQLRLIGATEEDIKEMAECQDEDLDITTFAFDKCGADYYVHGRGFGVGDVN